MFTQIITWIDVWTANNHIITHDWEWYSDGQIFIFKAANSNTSSDVSFRIWSKSEKQITNLNWWKISAYSIIAWSYVWLVYNEDTDSFQLMSKSWSTPLTYVSSDLTWLDAKWETVEITITYSWTVSEVKSAYIEIVDSTLWEWETITSWWSIEYVSWEWTDTITYSVTTPDTDWSWSVVFSIFTKVSNTTGTVSWILAWPEDIEVPAT